MTEAATETFVIACNYVHDHICRHSVLRSKALEADAILGTNTPWNSVYKSEVVPEKPTQLKTVPAPSSPSLRIARALR